MSLAGQDPLPPVEKSGLNAGVSELVALPPTVPGGSAARIHQLVDAPDATDQLYAVDNRGVIRVIEDGQIRDEPFLNLLADDPDFTASGGEMGIRSVAFHPDFAIPGRPGYGKVYTTHTATPESAPPDVPLFDMVLGGIANEIVFHDVVTEWTVSDPAQPFSIDLASRRELLRVEEAFANHNTGQLLFNPNAEPGDEDYGLLYVGVGDGGFGGDPNDVSEDLGQIQGKLLRIDPIEQANGAPYGIPASNPFVGDADALAEIFALGLRNPQTFSFDTEGSGALFLGDIGQNLIEEINIILSGGDYGWDQREGTFDYNEGPPLVLPGNDASFGYQYPIAQYDHQEIVENNPFPSSSAAVAGGFVYRGTAIPELYGHYLFVDFPTGRIFHFPVDDRIDEVLADGVIGSDEQIQPQELTLFLDGIETTAQDFAGRESDGRVDLRFGADNAGELYIFSKQNGEIWTLGISGEAITGTTENETLVGTDRSDVIRAGAGDDRVVSLSGNDFIDGGAGNDRLYDDAGDSTLEGRDGDDIIAATFGDDQASGGNGNDWIGMGPGADLASGGAGNDTLHGYDAQVNIDRFYDDTVDGNDTLHGQAGDDLVLGAAGDDMITGRDGDDRLEGGDGDDWLAGGTGADTLEGGAGDDTLNGFDATDNIARFYVGVDDLGDRLTGGAGRDAFTYYAVAGQNHGADVITDFEDGLDLIGLRGYSGTDLSFDSTTDTLSLGDGTTVTLANFTGSFSLAEDVFFF